VFLTVIAVAQIIRAYQNPVSFSPYVAYIATIAFILLLVGSYCFYRSEVHIAADLLKDIKIVIPLGAVFALAVLSVSVARPKMSDIEVFSSPGVIFVVAMAILTVLGFFLTVSKLHEMQSRILGYDVLMERCTELVRAEVSRVANENKPGKLIVFANAPGFGNMSAPDQFDRYRQELHKLIDLSTARVVLGCLSWEGGSESRHDNFYSEHWGNREDFGARVAESRNIAEKVVERYDPVSDNKMAYALVNEIQEVPFHLVLTSERAILFVSLNYPRRNNAAGGSSDTAHVPTPQKPARIIAWETNDTAVREALEEGVMARLTNPAYARRVLPPGKAPAAAVNTP
jgi:hypothetical protein